MANPGRTGEPDTKRSEQGIQNLSFDEEFGVLVTELLGYTALEETKSVVRLAAVESADNPGVYGLLVLNADGSSVSTGGSGGGSSDPSGGLDNLMLVDGSSNLTLQSDTTNDVLLLA